MLSTQLFPVRKKSFLRVLPYLCSFIFLLTFTSLLTCSASTLINNPNYNNYHNASSVSYTHCQTFTLTTGATITDITNMYRGTGGTETVSGIKIRSACNSGDIATANGTWGGSIPSDVYQTYTWYFTPFHLDAGTYYYCYQRGSQKNPAYTSSNIYSGGTYYDTCSSATRDFYFVLNGNFDSTSTPATSTTDVALIDSTFQNNNIVKLIILILCFSALFLIVLLV